MKYTLGYRENKVMRYRIDIIRVTEGEERKR